MALIFKPRERKKKESSGSLFFWPYCLVLIY
ncbi:hypothetical protein SGRA_0346 [Saprospira grandis str. Lewin]|uniref:Uncharacterized protein n=1 Tax=Saprospira grandis (strain Lewin) TaxID=984262 RepID=H6L7Q3_SAPGL|nr:hypothetical protein SGRA_0346 [Saprospira grandis str. Lewin]